MDGRAVKNQDSGQNYSIVLFFMMNTLGQGFVYIPSWLFWHNPTPTPTPYSHVRFYLINLVKLNTFFFLGCQVDTHRASLSFYSHSTTNTKSSHEAPIWRRGTADLNLRLLDPLKLWWNHWLKDRGRSKNVCQHGVSSRKERRGETSEAFIYQFPREGSQSIKSLINMWSTIKKKTALA